MFWTFRRVDQYGPRKIVKERNLKWDRLLKRKESIAEE